MSYFYLKAAKSNEIFNSDSMTDLPALGAITYILLKYPLALLYTAASFIFPSLPFSYAFFFWLFALLPLDEFLPDWFWSLFFAALMLGLFLGFFYLLVLIGFIN